MRLAILPLGLAGSRLRLAVRIEAVYAWAAGGCSFFCEFRGFVVANPPALWTQLQPLPFFGELKLMQVK